MTSREAAAELPEPLAAHADRTLARLGETVDLGALPGDVRRVLATSEYVRESLERDPENASALVRSGRLAARFDRASYERELVGRLAGADGDDALMRCLRAERRREMVRIAWRDIAGLATLEETLADLTALAEVLVDAALDRVHARLETRFGVPRSAAGEPQRLIVLGLGKLGSYELNFSSDIDLIFAYPEAGATDGEHSVANEQYFSRLAQRLIHVLGERTGDGFVFRVDMRLRPFGTAGALTASFDQLEEYYQSYGRDWERFAFIRARVVAGDRTAGAKLLARLRPFVYRRYLDFGALESLRLVKQSIAHDLRGKRDDPEEGDIKRGRGGIRELEFVVQAFQLLRGAAHRELQGGPILALLPALRTLELLSPVACASLEAAYRFLRSLENRLQALRDQQTHTLPGDSGDRLALAAAMGFSGWEALERTLEDHRRNVRAQFELVLGDPETTTPEGAGDGPDLARVWEVIDDPEAARKLLRGAGLARADALCERLAALKDNYRTRTLDPRGQRRIATLIGLLLGEIAPTASPLETLGRVLTVIEGILQRTAYLALLTERPAACRQLVRLCAASPWLAQHLARHPQTFDELLDPRSLYAPPQRAELEENLAERLAAIPRGDQELEMDALRYFQQANVLRVAAAEIAGAIPLMVVSDRLTDIAETCLNEVLELARRDLASRHGEPTCRDREEVRVAPFGVIAYGKLGGIELSYGSDLDLVFLHGSRGEQQVTDGERPVDNSTFFARLAQRMIHYLSAHTAAGRLYEVDARLRPSGAAGLLVTSIEAFERYQRREAWTWEHQALVRARYVAGDVSLGREFERVRREVLLRPRDPHTLRAEVRDMRLRMQSELGTRSTDRFDLKQDPGGIADIEFLVQYGALRWAEALGDSLRFTDNVRLLDGFERCEAATPAEASFLRDAYRAYRARVHELDLQAVPSVVDGEEFTETRARVRALWHEWMDDERES